MDAIADDNGGPGGSGGGGGSGGSGGDYSGFNLKLRQNQMMSQSSQMRLRSRIAMMTASLVAAPDQSVPDTQVGELEEPTGAADERTIIDISDTEEVIVGRPQIWFARTPGP